ncbi:MAG: hypothetical protein M3N11_05535 [Actinomycetota bacterium]|nr:hypothetical protein [Actinomycetota bacterium]
MRSSPVPVPGPAPAASPPARSSPHFAHESERRFAALLDFYGIEWQYEPRTFVLDHDPEGRPTRAFCPDFFLPAYDLFIELTTLSQKLITRKNAKVRRLRELHPDVSIKVLYRRDYLSLLDKYGLGGGETPPPRRR